MEQTRTMRANNNGFGGDDFFWSTILYTHRNYRVQLAAPPMQWKIICYAYDT